jgi:two-component system, OmpR family, response regulator
MTPGRILVVDDDPWIQRIVARTLGQRGHQVTLAGDAPGAFALASKTRPDLIITAVSLPAVDGWSWWERLRALPAAAETPIIFLLSELDGSTGVRGASPRDQMLRKPFRMEDLDRTVVHTLGGGSVNTLIGLPAPTTEAPEVKPSAGHRPLSALRGRVDEISLASILGMLEMERKTGIILIERVDASARFFLRKGHIIRADCDHPHLTGAAAVFEALAWSGASFDFLVGDIGGVDEIQTSTTFLLLESARRTDETNEQRRVARPERKT